MRKRCIFCMTSVSMPTKNSVKRQSQKKNEERNMQKNKCEKTMHLHDDGFNAK